MVVQHIAVGVQWLGPESPISKTRLGVAGCRDLGMECSPSGPLSNNPAGGVPECSGWAAEVQKDKVLSAGGGSS